MTDGYLVHLFGKDDSTDPATDITLRLSSAPYHKSTNIYRSRITRLELIYDMESSLDEVRSNTAAIDLGNNDGALDNWYQYRLLSGKIRRGDLSKDYSDANFPVIWDGPILRIQRRLDTFSLVMADRLSNLNVLVRSRDLPPATFSGIGAAGTMLKGYLTFAHDSRMNTGISESDLDLPSFTGMDNDLPAELKIALGDYERINYLEILDRIINGTGYVLTLNRAGKLMVVKFEIDSTGDFTVFEPAGVLTFEHIAPGGEVRPAFIPSDPDQNITLQNTRAVNVQRRWPNLWRTLPDFTLYSNAEGDTARRELAQGYAESLLSFFGLRYERIRFETWHDLEGVEIGDTVEVLDNRTGTQTKIKGQLTRIRERLSGIHELEIWSLNDDGDPGATSPSVSFSFLLPNDYANLNDDGMDGRFWGNRTIAIPADFMEDGLGTHQLTSFALVSGGSANSGTVRPSMAINIDGATSGVNFASDLFDFGSVSITLERRSTVPGRELMLIGNQWIGRILFTARFSTGPTIDLEEPYSWAYYNQISFTADEKIRRAHNNLAHKILDASLWPYLDTALSQSINFSLSFFHNPIDYSAPEAPIINSASFNYSSNREITITFTRPSKGEISHYKIEAYRFTSGGSLPSSATVSVFLHPDYDSNTVVFSADTFGVNSSSRFLVQMYAESPAGQNYRSEIAERAT